ncbi:MAG: DUF448 domain-containing protein [Sandaracinaceae bacterium]
MTVTERTKMAPEEESGSERRGSSEQGSSAQRSSAHGSSGQGSSGQRSSGQGSTRTCVGCRGEDAPSALLRLAIQDEAPRLVPDVRRKIGGRGVHVHPTRACLEQAVRRGGFARAMRGKLDMDLASLSIACTAAYDRHLEGLFVAAFKSRQIDVGTDATLAAVGRTGSGSARLVIIAKDAAGRRAELEERASRAGVPVLLIRWQKQDLGARLGRSEVGVVAILNERIAKEVAWTENCAIELEAE